MEPGRGCNVGSMSQGLIGEGAVLHEGKGEVLGEWVFPHFVVERPQ